ncbi:MAG: AtpZ/AtpI family protein [Bacteroidia bacterium]|nr:AtpZ/AtpI family protein [Bacteroidia bacterium]
MKDNRSPYKEYLRYTGLGFEILACILLFVAAGYGLDKWIGTEKPWFLLALSIVGCLAAILLAIRNFK